MKKTKSTLPIDIPDQLRKECSPHLAALLSMIINNSLAQSIYPKLWKQEWVINPRDISDLRKISSISDYSKVYEGFIKDWIMEDVCKNIDIGQYGGQPVIGTEHMVVCFMERILQLLDSNHDHSAVLATFLDWSQAFDRQDPTKGINKFIKLGVRLPLSPCSSVTSQIEPLE